MASSPGTQVATGYNVAPPRAHGCRPLVAAVEGGAGVLGSLGSDDLRQRFFKGECVGKKPMCYMVIAVLVSWLYNCVVCMCKVIEDVIICYLLVR